MLVKDWFKQKLESFKDDPEFQAETRLLELKEYLIMNRYIDRGLEDDKWILANIQNENENQVEKWGIQCVTAFEWLTYTTEELGELAQAIKEYEYRDGTAEQIVKEAIQLATLALKIAEIFKMRVSW